MKAAIAIAGAEIRQHRLVIWAGLLLGLLPLASYYAGFTDPLSSASPTGHGGEFPDGAVWILAIVLSIAVACGLGAKAVAPDLSSRRLGFWLARPIPALHYWAGKIASAWLLAVAAAVLVMLPAHVVGSMGWADTAFGLGKFVGGPGWIIGLGLAVAATSAGASALRARSWLLLVDVVMVPVVWGLAWLALGDTWQAGTMAVLMVFGMRWLLFAATAVLLAAGAAQVVFGRLELGRGHVVLSAITWGGLLLAFVGGIHAFSAYVSSVTPAELRLPQAVVLHAPPAGDRVLLAGISSRWWGEYEPGYLVTADGEFVRIGGFASLHASSRLFDAASAFAWSHDGRVVAGSRNGFGPEEDADALGGGFGPAVWVRRTDQPGAAARTFALAQNASIVAISPSGERLLLSSRGEQRVLEAETGRTLASVEDSGPWLGARFLSETLVRALRRDPGGARIVDWDTAAGSPAVGAMIPIAGGAPLEDYWLRPLWPSVDWRRVLRHDASGLHLHDLDGSVRTLVDGWPERASRTAGPLSGDRFGCIETADDGLRLRVFGADGSLLADARLAGRFPVHVGGEPVAGVLAVGIAPLSGDGGRETLYVDLATGNVARRERAVSTAYRAWESLAADRVYPEPGSLATRLVFGDDGLLSLDPNTGARTVLVARRRPELEE